MNKLKSGQVRQEVRRSNTSTSNWVQLIPYHLFGHPAKYFTENSGLSC